MAAASSRRRVARFPGAQGKRVLFAPDFIDIEHALHTARTAAILELGFARRQRTRIVGGGEGNGLCGHRGSIRRPWPRVDTAAAFGLLAQCPCRLRICLGGLPPPYHKPFDLAKKTLALDLACKREGNGEFAASA